MFNNRSGVGQYTKRLMEALTLLDFKNNYTVFKFNQWPKPETAKPFDNKQVKYRYIRFFPGRIYSALFKFGVSLPIDVLLRESADVIWFPNFIRWPIHNKNIRSLVTIYDISFISHGQFTSPANKKYMLKFVPRSISKASHIITISKNSKKEIVEYFKVDPAKISIVNPAINHSEYYPRPQIEISKIINKYDLPKKYILFVGTLEPRKNIIGLIDAYAALEKDIKDDYSLVLAGGKGWLDSDILGSIQKRQRNGERIIKLGYVEDEDLPILYSGAGLFVFPTFYEGFGMPPLEAMACGTPAITSDNSSLPEVVGSAAIKLPAEDTAGFTREITRVLRDHNLADTMIKAGIKQAGKFSWETSAENLLKVINGVVQ